MEVSLEIENVQDAIALFGNRDENVIYMRENFGVQINLFSSTLKIGGEEQKVNRASAIIKILLDNAKTSGVNKSTIDFVAQLVDSNRSYDFKELTAVIGSTAKGKQIKCKTYGQALYIRAIQRNSIVFGIGPAGTGKTYLAVAMAVNAFKNKSVDKIILTRPAVEAGEKLGFLPGDLGAKVDPYLRPLFDALQELFGLEVYNRLMEKGSIEIAPLAYMRGRTLSNAFIILDEAQNTTREQMKMFLTRMGENSRIVVTGDITQIDLPIGKNSGLLHASHILKNIDGIQMCHLTDKDIVRHPLVQAIVNAYERKSEPQITE